jgi:hypothetical protein
MTISDGPCLEEFQLLEEVFWAFNEDRSSVLHRVISRGVVFQVDKRLLHRFR